MFKGRPIQLPDSNLVVEMGVNECQSVCKITDSRGNVVFIDCVDIKALHELFKASSNNLLLMKEVA